MCHNDSLYTFGNYIGDYGNGYSRNSVFFEEEFEDSRRHCHRRRHYRNEAEEFSNGYPYYDQGGFFYDQGCDNGFEVRERRRRERCDGFAY